MGGEETAGADEFHRLAIIHFLIVHILAEALQADECGMALIGVVDCGMKPDCTQGADAADTKQDFLFQTVLPVATI